ncbi:hypothetical protein F5Y18DRAFT_374095 [Xylariaceae sp. FL1019]|nr:hypothetical protein F5Y18DRAFT_374095 [Xylariaceae sp. FL1019]
MLAEANHPVYTGIAVPLQKRLQLGRRCSKYDFGKFQLARGSAHCLGSGSIGEMDVACKFVFSRSKWGVLGSEADPGGVVYLDLLFTEPPNCQLRGATVTLTLDEYDKDLEDVDFSVGSAMQEDNSRLPVHIVSHGPGTLAGQPTRAIEYHKMSFKPHINAGGFAELGGMGREYGRKMIAQSQWRFTSQTQADYQGSETKLRWDLSENELDKHSKHSNTIHTAFAFSHSGKPFLMQVDVKGTLKSKVSNVKHTTKQTFRKFKFLPRNQANATTLINFGGKNDLYRTPLDELAQRIPQLMVQENLNMVEYDEPGQTKSSAEFNGSIEEDAASNSAVPSSETRRMILQALKS